ncbi:MAG TPA: GNAT family N-acetyltransferase [Amycolatopsis sp.]|nr:GNAT family N-acetyltransferase [Amycolatopsis sp.]
MIVLETDRLVLRRFTEADIDALAALHGDPAVMRYIDDGKPVPRDVVERDELPRILNEYRTEFGQWAAEHNGEFVGWFALKPSTSVGLDGIELGYRLRPAVWGRGFGTEGARALVAMGFGELGVARIGATTMTVNAGSRRVLEKAGLRLIRTFFEEWPVYLEGAEHGDVEYALTRHEWVSAATARP